MPPTDDVYVGLPIGTYEFTLDGANKGLEKFDDTIHFATIEHEPKTALEKFQAAYKYFNQAVLNGLITPNEDTVVGELRPDYNGTLKQDLQFSVIPEINEKNISSFIANATTNDKKTSTFYLGTDKDDKEAHRGNDDATAQDTKLYTNDRLGIILLATGMTQLTIEEVGALSNESFIYHITGKTLGGKEVDLYVSVEGGGSTTVNILPGDYVVEEMDDWSWKYDNKNTYGKDGEIWKLYEDNLKKAETSLRYRDDFPILEEHKTVTYEHERNEKVWLGGENHNDNRFGEIN